MASTHRRGAHAAAVPKPAVGVSTPGTGSAGRITLSSLRARLTPLRLALAVLVLGFGTVVVTGGLWSSPSAEPTVQQFLLAWQQHSYASAAALTTGNTAAVTRELANAYSRLDAAAFYLNMGEIRQSGGTATAHFTASVDLGQDGAPWTGSAAAGPRRRAPASAGAWSRSRPGAARGPGRD